MSEVALESMAGPQFKLSEEQDMLVRMARDFVADNIIPVAAEYDEKAIFPEEIFHKARELGIVNMLIPEAYGGVGASCFEEALVSEELGYGCTGISTSLGVNSLAMLPILIAGSDEQKAYWLGERAGERGEFCSYGVTEANAGSNVAGIQTRADKKGAAYIINGSKTFITNASYAHFYTIFAKTDLAAGHRGMTCFIVDRDSPGLSVGKKFDKLGQRASDTAEIVFENVEVPEENIVGEVGQGFYIAMKVFRFQSPGSGGRRLWLAAARLGRKRQICEGARSLRPADLSASGGGPQDRGYGDQLRSVAPIDLAGRLAGGRGRVQSADTGLCQSFRGRHGDEGGRRCGAGLRRIRLYERVSGGKAAARCEDFPDL